MRSGGWMGDSPPRIVRLRLWPPFSGDGGFGRVGKRGKEKGVVSFVVDFRDMMRLICFFNFWKREKYKKALSTTNCL
jgi:hypothetical protein